MTLLNSGFYMSVFIRNVHNLKPGLCGSKPPPGKLGQAGRVGCPPPQGSVLRLCSSAAQGDTGNGRGPPRAQSTAIGPFLHSLSLPARCVCVCLWWGLNQINFIYLYITLIYNLYIQIISPLPLFIYVHRRDRIHIQAVGWIMNRAQKICSCSHPQNLWKCDLIGKKVFAGVITWRISRWDHPGLGTVP